MTDGECCRWQDCHISAEEWAKLAPGALVRLPWGVSKGVDLADVIPAPAEKWAEPFLRWHSPRPEQSVISGVSLPALAGVAYLKPHTSAPVICGWQRCKRGLWALERHECGAVHLIHEGEGPHHGHRGGIRLEVVRSSLISDMGHEPAAQQTVKAMTLDGAVIDTFKTEAEHNGYRPEQGRLF